MTSVSDLAFRIAEVLKNRATHATLPGVAKEACGLLIASEPMGSRGDRIFSALEKKTEREIGEFARRLGLHFNDFDLEEVGLAVLERHDPPLTEITRRDVARCFRDDLSGERPLLNLVKTLFPIDMLWDDFARGQSLASAIERYMVRNPGDWSVEALFERIGALSCSRNRFARLIEAALHPLARRGQTQAELVEAVDLVLRRDGYTLNVAGEESGYPILRFASVTRGVAGSPKNLIFASTGPKPEIGFSDAINNDIIILSNADSCLVYDKPIRRDGLLWSELVDWWRSQHSDGSSDAARDLGMRLRSALASDAERTLFDTYFRLYRQPLGEALPAMIPQVYLHYDPAVVKRLRDRDGLPRQRMDFLLLLPGHQRVVIEVDGVHHFSEGGSPSLAAYARMVAADRDLRLSGYEIYRFGANELVGRGAQAEIQRFFDRMWSYYLK